MLSGCASRGNRATRPVSLRVAALAMLAAVTGAVVAAERPRVGLVLSGGGARGVAHIGVLQVLEEMRIPVDCVAGTSMGSLVGGAYSAGVPLATMESVLKTADWDNLFSDDPPRTEKPERVKSYDFQPFFRFEVGQRGTQLLLPPGTTAGYKFEFLLRELLAPAGNYPDQDFDRLPIPFRAVATNLENGLKTVFREGDLVKALRASMSVPGVLAPVEVAGALHVDGGLVDNLPIDVAREACAEVVIAVNLGSPLLKRDELRSVVGVAVQSVNLLTEQNVRASLASLRPEDILIEPKLGNFSAGDFKGATVTIPIGEQAARVKAAELSRLSVTEDEYAAWRRSVMARLPKVPPVTEVRVATDGSRVNPAVIESELEEVPGIDLRRIPETDFSLSNLHTRLSEVYGRGDFERMDYRIVDTPGGRVVEVRGVEKSWGPNYLRFGLGIAGDRDEGRFEFVGSHRMTWLNSLGAEWRNDVAVGFVSGWVSEFYQPLAQRSGLFVAPRLDLASRPLVYYLDQRRVGEYDVSHARAHLDLGIQSKYGEVRIGAFGGRLRAREDFGLLTIVPDFDVTQVGYTASAVLDRLDSTGYARRGYLAALRTFGTVSGWGSDDHYNKSEIWLQGATSFGPHTIGAAAFAGGKLAGTLPPYDTFQLGGFLRGSGYRFDELAGERVMLARVVYTYELARLPSVLGSGIFVGGSLEGTYGGLRLRKGDADSVELNRRVRPSASLFLGAETFLGPAYLGYGSAFGDNRSGTWYVLLGITP